MEPNYLKIPGWTTLFGQPEPTFFDNLWCCEECGAMVYDDGTIVGMHAHNEFHRRLADAAEFRGEA